MIIFLGFIIGIIAYWWYKQVERQNQEIEYRKIEREMERKSRESIANLYEERKKKPLLCQICTKKKHKKTYFEGLSWYHCPDCGRHGFASIDSANCTGCANTKRFGSSS